LSYFVGSGCGPNNQNYLWQVSTQDFMIRFEFYFSGRREEGEKKEEEGVGKGGH
jgi:hypothetical protein